MNQSYTAALLYAPQDLRLERLPFEKLQSGEVRVKIVAATTCGTDKKTFLRGHPVLIKSYPARLGHEMAGVVAEIGAAVKNFKAGDRVIVANSAPCLNCFYCRKNSPNLCENLVFLNGAFAEYIVVPEQIVCNNLHLMPQNLDFAKAALTEPLACVIHAITHMQIHKGEMVVLIGTGPMALFFVQLICKSGAQSLVVGRNEQSLSLLKSHGASHVINNTKTDWVEQIKKMTGGHGADVAIEAVGLPELWQDAVALVRKGGRVCLYGGCKKDSSLTLDTYRLHYEEITVSGVFHHTPKTIQTAMKILASNSINVDVLLKEKRPLSALPQLLSGTENTRALKYVIEP